MRVLCTITTVLLGLAPATLAAQQVTVASPAEQRLRVTTASEEAAGRFWAGLADGRNIFFSRATMHLDKATELDAGLGLARVLRAVYAPGLTTDERKAAIDVGISGMTSATTGELVTALAFREFIAGNNQQAQALFKAASKLLPGDPNIAFYHAFSMPATEREAAFRAVTERFPDDAPSYNILGYTLWQRGDRAGGLAAVRRYVRHAPDHPNSHDSYAEILQWEGRFGDALTHYGRAAQLDSNYTEAYVGTAEVLQLTGRGAEARAQLQRAIGRAPSQATAINYTRAVGHSFLMDGMVKEGMAQLAAAARAAQAQKRAGVAAQIHRDMAVAEALLGRGGSSAIAAHLAAAAASGAPDATPQLLATAVAHGTAGDVAAARRAAEQLATRAATDSQLVTAARTASAVILLREKKAREAIKELSTARPDDALVRALLAEAYRMSGNVADARAIRSRVVDNPQFNLVNSYQTTARIRAARIKI